MHFRSKIVLPLVLLGMLTTLAVTANSVFAVEDLAPSDTIRRAKALENRRRRETPLVTAVQNCRKSVVNLRGRKTVPADPNDKSGSKRLKQVNGMGTGVVIDSRGYVLTNFHVVEGVKVIEVTTYEREKTTAKLIAHDPVTDLAILKIETKRPLPSITIGTSSDLMLGEDVCAVGNAYGYEHTVTLGIVSALSRTVQVNDEQIYRNLIQTDAAINPGNSGGPLLNINGEMIGIVVAVRIGAQGIAFAIPVNQALETAAELLTEVQRKDMYHGLSLRTQYQDNTPSLVVDSVSPSSPASTAGLVRGDKIYSVNGKRAFREIDFQSSLLGLDGQQQIRLGVIHADRASEVVLALDASTEKTKSPSAIAWSSLGLMLVPANPKEMQDRHPNYTRGLKVTKVKPGSPADSEGILPGDILVAMHGWKTESLENMAYILERREVLEDREFMFFILRDKEPLWGQMRVAKLPTR